MKHRDDIYLVVREKDGGDITVCSAHPTEELAYQEADNNNQLFKDKGWNDWANFTVWVTTFYNE